MTRPLTLGAALVVGAACLAGACDDRPRSFNAPSPPRSAGGPSQPGPSASTHQLSGRVLDEERNPVAGVQVSVLLPRVVATTDETGAYALTLQNAPAYVEVTVAADGYGSSVYQVPLTGPGETRRDFRASRLTVVRPGESVDMRLYPDDPTCGFDLEFFCRSVSVHSPTSGLVEVTLTQGEGFLASGSDVTYPLAGLRSTLISFDQGDTHPILVLRWWSSSRLIETITLKATLK